MKAEDEYQKAAAEGTAWRYRERVEGIDAVVWEAHPDTLRFVFVSQHAEIMLGYPVDHWLATPDFFAQLIYPDDREAMLARCRSETAQGHDHRLEYRALTADGRTVWLRNSVRVVRDATGRPERLRGLIVDITELRQPEKIGRQLSAALEAAIARDTSDRERIERQMAGLLDVAKDIAGSVDLDAILERVQRHTAELLPCDRVATFYWDPVRKTFRDIARYGVPAALLADAVALEFAPGTPIADELTGGKTALVNDAADQRLVPAALLSHFGIRAFIATPLAVRGRVLGALVAVRTTEEAGFAPDQVRLLESIAHHVAIAFETTELYRAQQEEAQIAAALARVGREMISLLDTPALLDRLCQLTTEVLDCDASHTILWKPEGDSFVPVAAYGYPAELWEALRLLVLPRERLAESLAPLEQNEVTQQSMADLSDPGLRLLGKELGLTVAMGMALRRGRQMIGFHSACRLGRKEPFTPQQERIARGMAQLASLALENARLVEELDRASRLKSDFVATMSHELRTPLNVIVGYNDLLLDGAFGSVSPEQSEALLRMEGSAAQLLELINTTLDVSRLEAGRLPVNLEEVDPAALLREVDAETRDLQERHGLQFTWSIPPLLPRLRTDPVKLKIVLKNLIGNAIKFTEHGSVTVNAAPLGNNLEFHVSDTGIGIAPEAQSVIFEPFRQADGSTTRRHGGVGLGLYIARRLIEMLGGTVEVHSEVGKGATFCVSLPIAGAE